MSKAAPKGWNAGATDTRFADVAPQSYDKARHTVDCVVSMGTPVKRFYGTEVLRISPQAVDLDRMKNGGIIPLLDTHNGSSITNALGRFEEMWFKRGALMGRIVFNQTEQGKVAEGMVARGEIAGISAGYAVNEWEIADADGRVIAPDAVRWDDDLTFTATKWSLHEGSLVAVPAEGSANGIRSFGSNADRPTPEIDELARRSIRITKRFGDASVTYEFAKIDTSLDDVRARMQSRQKMHERMIARG